jgi:hypothetical protein
MRGNRSSRSRARPAPALAILGMVAIALAGAPARANDRPGPCDLHRQPDESMRAHSKELIRCAEKRWPVPGGARTAICIADRESGLDPTAISSSGRYRGLFQHDKRYWSDRYEQYARRAWRLNQHATNGRTNAVVSMRMVNAGSWAAWGGKNCH